jgi:hypothetical protein
MLKRDRPSSTQIVVSNVADGLSIEQVALFFTRFGHIDHVLRIARRTFAILYQESGGVSQALKLNHTHQPELGGGLVNVRIAESEALPATKRPKRMGGSFAVIYPPRSGNSLVPTLPSFLYFDRQDCREPNY